MKKIIISIIFFFLDYYGIIRGNKTVFAIGYSILWLAFLFSVLIFILNLHVLYIGYRKKKEELIKPNATFCEKITYPYAVASLRKECIKNRLLGLIIKKVVGYMGVLAVLLISVDVSCAERVDEFQSELKILIGINDVSDRSKDKEPEITEEDTSKQEDTQEQVHEEDADEKNTIYLKGSTWRFVLRSGDDFEFRNNEREEQVFFYQPDPEISWEKYVVDCMKDMCNERKKGVNYTNVKDEDGNDFFTYTELEDEFKSKVKNADEYEDYNEWRGVAPNYREWEKYIFGLEHLNKIEIEGEQGCYELWNRLANAYQYYAQEYERQTDNKKAVRYCYINSIYCCMQGLKYSISQEKKDKLYHYMVMRYHDMKDRQSKVLDEDRERASEIHSLLEKKDKYRKED